MGTRTITRARQRIAVRLSHHASPRQRRELGAFARYCIQRVERELGERESWVVEIAPVSASSYESRVRVGSLEASGTGPDGALATWDAICRLEEALRERARSY